MSFFFFYLSPTIRIIFLWFLSLVSAPFGIDIRATASRCERNCRPTDLRLPSTYVYLFCGELPKIFLMIRLQTTVPFPPLPGLDMGVGRIHYYKGRYLLSIFTCHLRPSIYLMIFPAFYLWRYRVACTVPLGQAGRYFLQEVLSLLINYQLIFSSTSTRTSR